MSILNREKINQQLMKIFKAPPKMPISFKLVEIECTKNEITLIPSSNLTYRIKNSILFGYFHECRQHTALCEYVEKFIDDYFTFIYYQEPFASSDKSFLKEALSEPQNFDKFTNMGQRVRGISSPVNQFLDNGDFSIIGLSTDNKDEAFRKRIIKFVGEYACSALYAYFYNQHVGINDYQIVSSSKTLATEAFASLLGISDMIPHAEYVKLIIDQKVKLFGLFMENASGESIMPIPGNIRREMITPIFQKNITSLNLMDALTHEMDHDPHNYNVIVNDDKLRTLSVFDNNGVGTFSLNTNPRFNTYKNCSCFVNSCMTINRPYIDEKIANRVLSLTFRDLTNTLSSYLNSFQLLALWRRTTIVKKAIRNTILTKTHFLLKEDEWSTSTIEEELNGTYGKTYLHSFFMDC